MVQVTQTKDPLLTPEAIAKDSSLAAGIEGVPETPVVPEVPPTPTGPAVPPAGTPPTAPAPETTGVNDATLTGLQDGGTFGGSQFHRIGDATFRVMPNGTWEYISATDFANSYQQHGLNLDVIPQFSGAVPNSAAADFEAETGNQFKSTIDAGSLDKAQGGGQTADGLVDLADRSVKGISENLQFFQKQLLEQQKKIAETLSKESDDLTNAREAQSKAEADLDLGLLKIKGQPVAMEAIIGQQGVLKEQAQARLDYLQRRVALLEGSEERKLDAMKFLYDANRNNLNDTIALYEATAPDHIGTATNDNGDVTVLFQNPLTGEVTTKTIPGIGNQQLGSGTDGITPESAPAAVDQYAREVESGATSIANVPKELREAVAQRLQVRAKASLQDDIEAGVEAGNDANTIANTIINSKAYPEFFDSEIREIVEGQVLPKPETQQQPGSYEAGASFWGNLFGF